MKKDDNLNIANVWNKEKEEYLQLPYKNRYIRNLTSSQCCDLGYRFQFHSKLKNPKQTTKELLQEVAKEVNADINVVGFHGRKGVKEDPTVMGTAVRYLSTRSTCPVLIIKDPHDRSQRPDGYRFAALVDGSRFSIEALELICRIR